MTKIILTFYFVRFRNNPTFIQLKRTAHVSFDRTF
jgi:hypothetical protein